MALTIPRAVSEALVEDYLAGQLYRCEVRRGVIRFIPVDKDA